VFGPVGTLQNVAVISSVQKTPVVGPLVVLIEVPVVVPVTTCAATGDVAKTSAVINASFFMCALVVRTRRCVLAAIEPERVSVDFIEHLFGGRL
jgi:hypothetical protein